MKYEPFILKKNRSFLQIECWQSNEANVLAGISCRQGGYSRGSFQSLNLGLHVHDDEHTVLLNRQLFAQQLGTSLKSWVLAEQVHGANIAKVTKQDVGKGALQLKTAIKECDGLYTVEKNIFLLAAFADCVPIFFFAPKKKMIGIVHAGWRGTVANIVGNMVQTWVQKEGVSLDDIRISIGPSIGKCCYIVNDFVIDKLSACLRPSMTSNIYNRESDGQYRLDLKQANFELLKKEGISSDHIEISNYCTSCRQDLFFSHRRDQGITGRMLGFIGWKND